MSTKSHAARGVDRRNLGKRICEFCRRRHLRCDGTEPTCLHCENRNLECVYVTPKPQPKPTPATRPPSEPEMELPPPKRPKLAQPKLKKTASPPSTHPSPGLLPPQAAPPTSATPQPPAANFYVHPPFYHQPPPVMIPHASGVGVAGHPVQQSSPPLRAPPQLSQLAPHTIPFLYQQHIPTMVAPPAFSGAPPTLPLMDIPLATSPKPTSLLPPMSPISPTFPKPVQAPHATNGNSGRHPLALKTLLQTENHRVSSISTAALVKALHECVITAHSCRYKLALPTAIKYAEKAYQIMVLIISTRQYKGAEFVEEVGSLLASMELLLFFYLGNADLVRIKFIAEEACRLIGIHGSSIKIPTAHRIFIMRMGICLDNNEALFWLKKADALNLPTDEAGAAGYISVILMMVGRFCGRTDLSGIEPHPVVTPEKRDFYNLLSFYIAKTEECVVALEKSDKPPQDIRDLSCIYRGVITGCRAVVAWQLGDVDSAVSEASKLIRMGRAAPLTKLAYLLIYPYALQIMRFLGRDDLLQEGLAHLQLDAPMFPLIQLFCAELQTPYIKPQKQVFTESLASSSDAGRLGGEPIANDSPVPQFSSRPEMSSAPHSPFVDNHAHHSTLIPNANNSAPVVDDDDYYHSISGLRLPQSRSPSPPVLPTAAPIVNAVVDAVDDYFGYQDAFLDHHGNHPYFPQPLSPSSESWLPGMMPPPPMMYHIPPATNFEPNGVSSASVWHNSH